jgi:hypothetical protein
MQGSKLYKVTQRQHFGQNEVMSPIQLPEKGTDVRRPMIRSINKVCTLLSDIKEEKKILKISAMYIIVVTLYCDVNEGR